MTNDPQASLRPGEKLKLIHQPVDCTQTGAKRAARGKPIRKSLFGIGHSRSLVIGLDLDPGTSIRLYGLEADLARVGMPDQVRNQFGDGQGYFFAFDAAETNFARHFSGEMGRSLCLCQIGNRHSNVFR